MERVSGREEEEASSLSPSLPPSLPPSPANQAAAFWQIERTSASTTGVSEGGEGREGGGEGGREGRR